MRISVVFKLHFTFLKPSPNMAPMPENAFESEETPADAASIIFPRKSGNRLVVNADNAIKIRLRINLER